jgi:hypothetical protein
MKIGEHYEINRIGLDDWKTLANAIGMDSDRLINMVISMAEKIPDAISAACEQALLDGLAKNEISRLREHLLRIVPERLATIQTITYPNGPAIPTQT